MRYLAVVLIVSFVLISGFSGVFASGGLSAIFSGQVFDGVSGSPVVATVHLDCTDGTHVDTMSANNGWYSIVVPENPAAWCTLWATDGEISSGLYGYGMYGWVRQDLTLLWHF